MRYAYEVVMNRCNPPANCKTLLCYPSNNTIIATPTATPARPLAVI